jgi:hypothetical protein
MKKPRTGMGRRPSGGAHGSEVHCGVVEGRARLLCLGESGSEPGGVHLSWCRQEQALGGLAGRAGTGARLGEGEGEGGEEAGRGAGLRAPTPSLLLARCAFCPK